MKSSKIAFIGGGFGSGIHNTLEPIAFGLPVIFGEKYQKFEEANYLVNSGGGFTVSNFHERTKRSPIRDPSVGSEHTSMAMFSQSRSPLKVLG